MAAEHRTTAEVVDDHLARARAGDLDGDLAANYASDVRFLSSEGVGYGPEHARELAEVLRRWVPTTDYRYDLRLLADDVAYLLWSATGEDGTCWRGTDTFVVRGGRIVVQTIWFTRAVR